MTGKPTGVRGYEYGDDHITVFLLKAEAYIPILFPRVEGAHLANMKRLANAKRGLNTYLTKNKPPFASKVLTIPSRMSRLIYLMATSRYNKDDNEDK